MDENKNVMSYEDFRETASDYGEDKGHDFLTDPAAVAKATEKAEDEKAVSHGDMLRAIRKSAGFPLMSWPQEPALDETHWPNLKPVSSCCLWGN